MAIVYVGTDGAKWGSGVGRRLTVSEHDNNNWQLHERILDLETATGAGITGFSVTGVTGFMVHMEDGTDFGPYALPLAVFEPRGEFLGGASYAVNDVFYINAKLYYVNIAHVAVAPFDANRNDGLGNYYYTLLIEMPTASLPTGGATGYNLRKASSTDFDYYWGPPLPVGGQTGYYLAKTSSTDFACDWIEPPTALPPSGGTGYVLWKASDASYDWEWADPLSQILPPSGVTGYFLGKNSSDTGDFDWLPALPVGGVTGAVLVKNSSTDLDVTWSSAYSGSPSVVTGTTGIGTAQITFTDRAKYLVRPTGDLTLTATGTLLGNIEVILTTTGTTAWTVTLGTGFKSTGTLSTGATGDKVFVIAFCGASNTVYEISRTTAM